MNAFDAHRRLARTMNFGLALDAPVEGQWGVTVQCEHLADCRAAGFTAIRLPVQWVTRTQAGPPWTVDPAALERVGEIIGWARDLGLSVVLGDHPDEPLMADPTGHHDRFVALWRQLTTAYADVADDVLLFELLCEPHGEVEAVWNDLFAETLAAVREGGATRAVVVGPTGFNRADRLPTLELPADDRNLIATFHWYLPVPFTMQGELWLAESMPTLDVAGWLGTTWHPGEAELAKVRQVFDDVQAWGRAHDRPVFLGEFGVTDHAEPTSRAAWIATHRAEAERRGFSWGYWSFGSLFSAYDLTRERWHDEVLTGLIDMPS